MKNILKNKLLIVMFLFFTFIVSILNFSFCSSQEYDAYYKGQTTGWKFSNINISFEDNEDSFVIENNAGNCINIYYFDSSRYRFINYTTNSNTVFLKYKSSNAVAEGCLRYASYSRTLDSDNKLYIAGDLIDSGTCSGFSYSSSIFCTADIVNENGEVVFQGAPQEEVPKVELMKATQVEEIPQQIAGILAIALPIFLTIFGILLVLYLIKSKNLLHL